MVGYFLIQGEYYSPTVLMALLIENKVLSIILSKVRVALDVSNGA